MSERTTAKPAAKRAKRSTAAVKKAPSGATTLTRNVGGVEIGLHAPGAWEVRFARRRFQDMSPEEQDAYAAESERMLDDLDPTLIATADRVEDLRAIRAIVEEQQALDRRLADAVALARASGRSWSDIASVLGVTKQSAHARFARAAADAQP